MISIELFHEIIDHISDDSRELAYRSGRPACAFAQTAFEEMVQGLAFMAAELRSIEI